MSHLRSQRSASPSDPQLYTQDSPTIGRAAVNFPPAEAVPISIASPRSQRKPIPSPLQTTTAASPPSSASSNRTNFPSPVHEAFPGAPVTQILRSSPWLSPSAEESVKDNAFGEGTFFREDHSPPTTPSSPNNRTSLYSPPPNASRSVADLASTTKLAGSPTALPHTMASGSAGTRTEAVAGASRTPSIDSAMSAISSRTGSRQDSQDSNADITTLIRAAGSPEAVIQYLLKDKHSQSQQNAQLWRLVDKQRAMILGLNKDLERAFKDKEKYRKKLKDVVAAHDDTSKIEAPRLNALSAPRLDNDVSKLQEVEVIGSPSNLDSGSAKNSPIDMTLAPYPITPPADQNSHALASAVEELLDPSHVMPKPSEHALNHFDREEEDRVIDEAKKASESPDDLPIQITLPPSRSLPSEPPRVPPPKPPTAHPPTVSVIEATPLIDQGISQFPPPSAPPPRKPPPAPLQLKKEPGTSVSMPPDDVNDSSSDYDSILEVDEIPLTEKRGRRRTREEDDRDRIILAQQEAETRSLSKKSKKGSQKGTPMTATSEPTQGEAPASPRWPDGQRVISQESVSASLAGVLNGDDLRLTSMTPSLLSPGLPSSPRPNALKSPLTSPPLSPRNAGFGAMPLSPRAPRQPIPLPPNTPLSIPSPAEPLNLKSPQPLNIVKQKAESTADENSPTERTKIFTGFVTDEYPDLLLPPNALPSIVVRVASSRMKPSRASLLSLTQLEEDPVFTLAIISRSAGGELWRVEKDTASLGKLDQRMKQCAAFTAKTPDRSLFSGHAPAKLDARRIALDQYLDELLNTPLELPCAIELCKYLSTQTLRPNADDPTPSNESNIDITEQKTGPGGRPFKTGYLTKRGKNFGGWKARYFVLDGPHLKYYETPGGAHLGTIKLQNAQIGKQSQHATEGSPVGGPNGDELDNQYRHAFLVLEPKKKDSTSHVKHVLCAESDGERDQWVETLLRWIDYRDPNDPEPPSNSSREQPNKHSNAVNAKKKMHAQSKAQPTRTNSHDGLIGVSYDSAKQGEIPDGAPSRRRINATPDSQERSTTAAYTISAPRDPQVITDSGSGSWGSRSTLAPPGPTTEEKKQRKRSFFGFGPKARSSSDDQEGLFGGNGGGPTAGQSEVRGTLRQVFGAPLAEAVRFNGPTDANVPLPAVVYRCIQYLDAKNAIREEGIFRLSGSNVVIKQLRDRFNTEGDLNLVTDMNYYDIHAVASLLKLYLRELPTTILTRELHMQFVSVTEMTDHREKILALAELVQRLPLANETLLKYLIAFLIKIINHADINKMTVRNVGIVFSPTLNIPAPVFALLLQNYGGIFGIDPEEYELPSPISEADSRPSVDPQPRRPSTGTATSSPHRQRLMEQTQQRSTPTPPPNLLPGGGLRPAPTPPPRQPISYEPQYLPQQVPAPQSSQRPAYETGFAPPAGYNPNMAHAQPPRQQPTYDQPHYAPPYEQDYGGAGYEEAFNSRAKRRESSMFMGNMMLNHQGSSSRLREENRL